MSTNAVTTELMRLSSVERPTREQFQALLLTNKPFIIKGAMEHWPLYRTLSRLEHPVEQLQYLADLLPKQKVGFSYAPPEQDGSFGFDSNLRPNFLSGTRNARFPEFARQVTELLWNPRRGTIYMQSLPLENLAAKLGSLDLFEGFTPVSSPRFWIGTGNQKVVLHNDPFSNVMAIFCGRKRISLFPPTELANLYIAPLDRRVGGVLTSLVDLKKPDFDKFPKYADALKNAYVTDLNPGEIVYLPPMWWHYVEGFDLNIGINCWFIDEVPSLGLYVPPDTRDLLQDMQNTSDAERLAARDAFVQTVEGKATEANLDAKRQRVVVEAKRLRAKVQALSPDKRARWNDWIIAFADQFVFRTNSDPFPTLSVGEFDRMVARLQRRRFEGLFRFLNMIRVRALNLWSTRADKEHGIVPKNGRTYLRLGAESVVDVRADGRNSSGYLRNVSLGGAYVFTETPPAVGTKVVLVLENDLKIHGSVVWTNTASTSDAAQQGFGMRFDAQSATQEEPRS